MLREIIEIVEGKKIKVDFSDLVNTYSDGGEQEFDDSYYFLNTLDQHNIEYSYSGDDEIEFDASAWKFVKSWSVKKVK